MGRHEKHLDPAAGPLALFAGELRQMRRAAGSPTYREMSKAARYSPSALSAAASGALLPSEGVVAAYAEACGQDGAAWVARRAAVRAGLEDDGDGPQEPRALASRSVEPERASAKSRRFFRHRAAGLLAAAVLGSLATVLPMAVWGAPTCHVHDHPAPAVTCHATPAR
jgi:anti-sigma factor RsiW